MNTLPGLRACEGSAPVLRSYVQVPLRLIVAPRPTSCIHNGAVVEE